MNTTYHTVRAGGLNIFYREAGPKDSPAILFLHGFPSSSRMFETLFPLLSDRYHLIAPDYPGFGYSDAPDPHQFSYTFDHLAAIVDSFTAAIGLKQYTLYMQDYGGPVGFRLAIAHPQRVQGMIIQNAVAHLEGLSPLWDIRKAYWHDRAAHEEALRANFTSLEATKQRHIGNTSHPERVNPDTWNDEYAFLTRPGETQIQLDLFYDYRTNLAAYPQWQQWLRDHQPRLLVLWGKYDPSFTVAGAEAYKKDVPGCEVVLLDAGHFALDEASEEIATHIKSYTTAPTIESHVRDFIKVLNAGGGGKPMETLSTADARKVLEGLQRSAKVDLGGIDVSEKIITQENSKVKLYIVRPAGTTKTLPAFLFFHGGGWILGDFPTHKRLVRDLVIHSGAASVFVEYSRSPEAKYPTALDECYAAAKWVSLHGEEIGVDGTRLAVVGNSAGGNLAAATALMARDKQTPKLRFQLLFWPVTNDDFNTASFREYADIPFLTRNMMIWFWDSYAPRRDQRAMYYAAPLKATLKELKGLPPAMVQTAENDVLRDEGEAYARKMDEAGVGVTLLRVQGMVHDFGLLNPLAAVPAAQAALRAAAAELANALK